MVCVPFPDPIKYSFRVKLVLLVLPFFLLLVPNETRLWVVLPNQLKLDAKNDPTVLLPPCPAAITESNVFALNVARRLAATPIIVLAPDRDSVVFVKY